VPKRKRQQREHTEDWQTIQQYTLWPEQTAGESSIQIVQWLYMKHWTSAKSGLTHGRVGKLH
jgi:hypothetical protein